MNLKNYKKEELLQKAVEQFEITSSVVNLLRTLTNDNATGAQRHQTRELAKEFIKDYDLAIQDARAGE